MLLLLLLLLLLLAVPRLCNRHAAQLPLGHGHACAVLQADVEPTFASERASAAEVRVVRRVAAQNGVDRAKTSDAERTSASSNRSQSILAEATSAGWGGRETTGEVLVYDPQIVEDSEIDKYLQTIHTIMDQGAAKTDVLAWPVGHDCWGMIVAVGHDCGELMGRRTEVRPRPAGGEGTRDAGVELVLSYSYSGRY